jgi:hypothetical protein
MGSSFGDGFGVSLMDIGWGHECNVSGHLKLHSGGQIIARWRTPKLHGIGGVLGAGTWGG